MTKNIEYKKTKLNDKFAGIFPFEFEESKGDIPDKIHIVPIGQWEHDLYGPMAITLNDINEFIQNFNMGVRKGVFITQGHQGWEEFPAVGWFTELEARSNGLWGSVSWNKEGKRTLTEKEFKFFSPEMCRDYEDPETHQLYRNVLTGGALTKSPYFKELEAIVFSDKNITSNFKKETMSKKLEEVLALDVAVLTDEDKAVIKENAETLSDEQKVTYASVLEVETPKEETPVVEEPKEDEPKVEEPVVVEEPKGDDTPVVEEPKDNEPIQAPEKTVTLKASELNVYKQAFAELEKKNLDALVSGLVFSESNKNGHFLPKSEKSLRAFMEKLNKEQRTAFSTLAKELPAMNLFKELGADNAGDGTAKAELDAKIAEKTKSGMTYSDALRKVNVEFPELAQRYNEEIKKGE